jgi:hypothetical protein
MDERVKHSPTGQKGGQMSMYKPGDLVWAKCETSSGEMLEQPATVTGIWNMLCDDHPKEYIYHLDIHPGLCGTLLRPRRDDYQQHEKLGSVETVRSLMKKEGAILVSA